jgi:predicted deacylase
MAEAFRAKVTWAHQDLAEGRTLSYAYDHFIPAIYSECPSTRCININDLEVYSRGALNVMKLIGMTQGKLDGSPSKYYLSGDGDTDQCVSATADGFFQPDKNLLDLVKKGESLGTIKSLSGELLEEIFSPIQGYVGMRRMLPSTHVGDSLFMIVDGFRS